MNLNLVYPLLFTAVFSMSCTEALENRRNTNTPNKLSGSQEQVSQPGNSSKNNEIQPPVLPEQRPNNNYAPLAQASLITSTALAISAHGSDGSDRAVNGVARFTGPLGTSIVSYKGYQYAVYYTGKDRSKIDSFGELVIGRRKLGSKEWQKSKLKNYRVSSDDAHNRQAIAVSEGDGVIHIAFDHHNNSEFNYAHTAVGVADKPESVVWNDDVFTYQKNMGFPAASIGSVTYPSYTAIPGGNLVVYFRNGGADGGEMRMGKYDAKSHKWIFVRNISTRFGIYKGNDVERGPYTPGLKVDSKGNLKIAWIWREKPVNCDKTAGNNAAFCNHGIYYSTSPDEGRTWLNADGEIVANTDLDEAISINNIGPEVVPVTNSMAPSNVVFTSALDIKTGELHVLLSHKIAEDKKTTQMHHYIENLEGEWTGKPSSFTGSDANMVFFGDYLYAFIGRKSAQVFVAKRDDNFQTWTEIEMPKFPETPINGYITWDTSMLSEGIASVFWQKDPQSKRDGDPSPIISYDIKISSTESN